MNANIINPFISAVCEVMPKLGFRDIKRGKILVGDKIITCRGITVVIGLTKQLNGNVAYNMTDETAVKIASTMMGTPISSLNELSQSAVSEMINMVTANAAIHLETGGIMADISPPSILVGKEYVTDFCPSKYLKVELYIDSELVEVNIGLEN